MLGCEGRRSQVGWVGSGCLVGEQDTWHVPPGGGGTSSTASPSDGGDGGGPGRTATVSRSRGGWCGVDEDGLTLARLDACRGVNPS